MPLSWWPNRDGGGRAGQWWRIGAVVVLALLLGVGLWRGPRVLADARLGVAYGARVGCACRYVEGRPLESCRTDFEAGMGMISLSEDAGSHAVTARFPLLASATARYADGAGCVLDKWGD
ncbi:hypothetical protein GTZ99_15320 [Novosphingobium sp. FSY-8]|uniref:Uncharacterized protein n=1 Tax=Novosphingobium ovatum TaxID=1908523 RepID=A0ABW9XHH2_9SPHN|nr:hypothetical protein [Novosphingobium ovatum]